MAAVKDLMLFRHSIPTLLIRHSRISLPKIGNNLDYYAFN